MAQWLTAPACPPLRDDMFLVDSHCHLDGLDYKTLHASVEDVLEKAAARDVKFCLAERRSFLSESNTEFIANKRNESFYLLCSTKLLKKYLKITKA